MHGGRQRFLSERKASDVMDLQSGRVTAKQQVRILFPVAEFYTFWPVFGKCCGPPGAAHRLKGPFMESCMTLGNKSVTTLQFQFQIVRSKSSYFLRLTA